MQKKFKAPPPNLARLLEPWGLTVFNWEKVKDVYKVETDLGRKNLKFSPLEPRRLCFVQKAIHHLIQKGFPWLRPLIPTLRGDTYISDGKYAYSLFDWIEGRQVDFSNPAEIKKSAMILADFHQKSRGFQPPEHSNMRNRLGKCLAQFQDRYQDLKNYQREALKNPKDSFAKVYLKSSPLFLAMAKQAINKIENSDYQQLVTNASLTKPFCHGDPAARNFIITPYNDVFLIDYDSCRLDLPIMDLIKLTRRVLKRESWNFQTARLLIDSYHQIKPISPSELAVIKGVFFFPQKFWRITNRYYENKHKHSKKRLLRKLAKLLSQTNNFARFLQEFDAYHLERGQSR